MPITWIGTVRPESGTRKATDPWLEEVKTLGRIRRGGRDQEHLAKSADREPKVRRPGKAKHGREAGNEEGRRDPSDQQVELFGRCVLFVPLPYEALLQSHLLDTPTAF